MLWPTAAAFSRVAARMSVDMLPAMQPAGPRAVADIILRSLNIDDLSLPASAAVPSFPRVCSRFDLLRVLLLHRAVFRHGAVLPRFRCRAGRGGATLRRAGPLRGYLHRYRAVDIRRRAKGSAAEFSLRRWRFLSRELFLSKLASAVAVRSTPVSTPHHSSAVVLVLPPTILYTPRCC